jgi:hypothetical protein
MDFETAVRLTSSFATADEDKIIQELRKNKDLRTEADIRGRSIAHHAAGQGRQKVRLS